MRKYTVETFAKSKGLTRQSAINRLSKLKKEGKVIVSGGGKQKRIYTVSNRRLEKTNGFYDVVNRYSPKKLVPAFKHYVHGRYTIEHAIIDGLKIGDVRTKEATMHLFNHVKNWKLLFDLAKKNNMVQEVKELYEKARNRVKVRRMPEKYVR
jgi:hypothetical protein